MSDGDQVGATEHIFILLSVGEPQVLQIGFPMAEGLSRAPSQAAARILPLLNLLLDEELSTCGDLGGDSSWRATKRKLMQNSRSSSTTLLLVQ